VTNFGSGCNALATLRRAVARAVGVMADWIPHGDGPIPNAIERAQADQKANLGSTL